jgi:hypothetical protein
MQGEECKQKNKEEACPAETGQHAVGMLRDSVAVEPATLGLARN